MARERFTFINVEESTPYSPEFIRHFQTALLLSLLHRRLLTQQQFEACEQEMQKRSQ